jgi:DNA-directed RNA polymerase subunit M
MDFCPNCGTRLTLKPKKRGTKVNLLLSCRGCGYQKRVAPSMVTIPKMILEHSPKKHIAVIGKKEQKLRTLPTVRIKCPRCGNNLAYTWQVQTRGIDQSSTQFFRCTKCSYTFRENG